MHLPSVKERGKVVVLNSKLFTCFLQQGCDPEVVGLSHVGEEMVSGLVSDAAREHEPPPAVRAVVTRRDHLEFSPA